mgnify:FL=1
MNIQKIYQLRQSPISKRELTVSPPHLIHLPAKWQIQKQNLNIDRINHTYDIFTNHKKRGNFINNA